MTLVEQKSILAIALYAAFADGIKEEPEREEIRRIAESLTDGAGKLDIAGIYQDVLLKRVSLEAATATLSDPAQRQVAYEMAVCVCDADGRQSETERRFLEELKKLLQLGSGQTAAFDSEANTIVELTETVASAGVFATTYALGQVTKRYYAGGRVMSTALLRETFQSLLEPAKQMQTQYLPQIREQAQRLDMGRVMAMIRQ